MGALGGIGAVMGDSGGVMGARGGQWGVMGGSGRDWGIMGGAGGDWGGTGGVMRGDLGGWRQCGAPGAAQSSPRSSEPRGGAITAARGANGSAGPMATPPALRRDLFHVISGHPVRAQATPTRHRPRPLPSKPRPPLLEPVPIKAGCRVHYCVATLISNGCRVHYQLGTSISRSFY